MTTILFSRRCRRRRHRRRRLVCSNRQSIANRNSGNADDVVNDNNSAMNSHFFSHLSLSLSVFPFSKPEMVGCHAIAQRHRHALSTHLIRLTLKKSSVCRETENELEEYKVITIDKHPK